MTSATGINRSGVAHRADTLLRTDGGRLREHHTET